jgi:hypothetical protein
MEATGVSPMCSLLVDAATARSLRIALLVVALIFPRHVVGLGTNAEIEENQLGLTARACAANFCHRKDSLDMWLDIEWYCHASEELLPTEFLNLPTGMDAYSLSPLLAGVLCALLGIFGFLIGVCLGLKTDLGRRQPPSLASEKNRLDYHEPDDPYQEKPYSVFCCLGGSSGSGGVGNRRRSAGSGGRYSKGSSYIRRTDYSQLPTADVSVLDDPHTLADLGGYHTQS